MFYLLKDTLFLFKFNIQNLDVNGYLLEREREREILTYTQM
jgi:hypothetical protein